MNPVVHFEMPYDDSDRAARFYRTAFGWNMKSLGEQMGHYLLATTTATAPDGRPTKPGAINGGFFAKKPEYPALPSVVIAVDDIQAAMAKIVRAGGEVLGEPMDIPGIGAYISCTDTEGNRVGVLQPLPMAKAAKKKAVAKKKPAAKKPAKKAVKAKKKAARKR